MKPAAYISPGVFGLGFSVAAIASVLGLHYSVVWRERIRSGHG